jgi:hypothetical protein
MAPLEWAAYGVQLALGLLGILLGLALVLTNQYRLKRVIFTRQTFRKATTLWAGILLAGLVIVIGNTASLFGDTVIPTAVINFFVGATFPAAAMYIKRSGSPQENGRRVRESDTALVADIMTDPDRRSRQRRFDEAHMDGELSDEYYNNENIKRQILDPGFDGPDEDPSVFVLIQNRWSALAQNQGDAISCARGARQASLALGAESTGKSRFRNIDGVIAASEDLATSWERVGNQIVRR